MQKVLILGDCEFYPVEGCDGPECYGIKINWQEAMDRVAKEGECG